MIIWLIGGLLIAALFLPQWWAQHVLAKYSQAMDDLPGTGADFARHLVSRHGLTVKVEEVEDKATGDHYDSENLAVRLSKGNYNTRSLTALTVAAHEVGHAIQDQQGYAPLKARHRLVTVAYNLERFGVGIMLALPVVTAILRLPGASILMLLAGLISLGAPIVVHLITLPVEWDASFNRALPILKQGQYLSPKELRRARHILLACAMTYVASSLYSLLNLARWITLLRR